MNIDYSPIMIAVEKVIIRHELEIALSKIPKNSDPIKTAMMHMQVYITHMKLFEQRYRACIKSYGQSGTKERQNTTPSLVPNPDLTDLTAAEFAERVKHYAESFGSTDDLPGVNVVIH